MTHPEVHRLLSEDHSANVLINGAIEAFIVALSPRGDDEWGDDWTKEERRARARGRAKFITQVIPAIERALQEDER